MDPKTAIDRQSGPQADLPGVTWVARPWVGDAGFVRRIMAGAGSLLQGMRVTFRYLSHPSTVVTKQYPENRQTLKMCERYRAQLAMPHDENGYHKCTACRQCETACPNGSITILSRKGASGRNELDQYVWRQDSCTFCNACVIACPFGAIVMNGRFEGAVFEKRLLVYNLNRYAGPTSAALMKLTDPEERRKLVEPRDVYSGPVPLRGVSVPGADAGAYASPAGKEQPSC